MSVIINKVNVIFFSYPSYVETAVILIFLTLYFPYKHILLSFWNQWPLIFLTSMSQCIESQNIVKTKILEERIVWKKIKNSIYS